MPTHMHTAATATPAWDDLTVLTTLFHLFAMSRALPFYSLLVAASTAASVAWHRDERNRALLLVDYGLALVWASTDAYLNWRTVPVNILTFMVLNTMDSRTAWHLVSAAKAAAVTHLLLAN
jgi:hypothetical protein